MRKANLKAHIIVIGISLALSSTAWGDSLAPGKPAGVHAAQMTDKEWLVLGGLGAVAAVILIGTAGGGHSAVATQAITVVAPTTT